MKEKKDVKFIIYQMLYVFVICVIALKGANLDLQEVIAKEDVVEKAYADSLRAYLDSLLALGLVPKITFDPEQKFNIEELQKQLKEYKNNFTSNYTSTGNTEENKTIDIKDKPEEQESKKPDELVVLKVQTLNQYTNNTITNYGNQTLNIIGSDGSTLASIPAGSSKTFILHGQTSVTYKQGDQSKTVSTKKNEVPNITLQSLAPSGEDVSIRKIQSTTGYRITIQDDFPEQLSVDFTGPVSIKQSGPLTYDVTLNFLGSKSAFDRYTDNKESPYSVNFRVTIKDKITGYSIQRVGTFTFGEW